MAWQLRHQGSTQARTDLSAEQIAQGLRDGRVESTDEVRGPGETQWQLLENHPRFAELVEELEPPIRFRHDEPTSLDMNALIDVCLVLLIFFILTTSYATTVQKVVPLPTVKKEEKKGVRLVKASEVQKKMIRVSTYLDQAGKPIVSVENQTVDALSLDGKTLDADKLSRAIRPYVQGEDRKTEVLLDAREVSWGTVVTIQDAAKAAGVHTIHHVLK